MHRASNFSNIGQSVNTIIVTNRGGQSNRKKGHSRLFNSIRISLVGCLSQKRLGILNNNKTFLVKSKVCNMVGWAESNQLLKHQVTSQALFFKCQSDQIYLCDSYELGLT